MLGPRDIILAFLNVVHHVVLDTTYQDSRQEHCFYVFTMCGNVEREYDLEIMYSHTYLLTLHREEESNNNNSHILTL